MTSLNYAIRHAWVVTGASRGADGMTTTAGFNTILAVTLILTLVIIVVCVSAPRCCKFWWRREPLRLIISPCPMMVVLLGRAMRRSRQGARPSCQSMT